MFTTTNEMESSAPRPTLQGDGSSSSTISQPSQHTFRASPSPSATSQSDDPDQDEEEEDDDEEDDDFTDVGSSQFQLKERRNTLKAKGSAALAVTVPTSNSSKYWQVAPADARNASAATLPHEILLHIFKYVAAHPPDLRQALTVCKSWCLCGVELLWHRPSFHRISSLFKMIHIIRRPDQKFPYASFVRRLSLSALATDLEDSLFGRLAVCTRLERLTLTGCTVISDDVISAVLSQTKHLVAADFSDVTQLTDKSILTIAQNCPRLQGMNISGCKLITSNSIATLARSCKLLRRVKLCGCELIGDKALTALAQYCPVLLEVDLINCPLITDTSVREMWKHSFHMRELRLAQCGKLTDLAFPAPNSIVGNVSTANIVGMGGMMSLGGMGQIAALQQDYSYYGGSESAPASRGTSPFSAQDHPTSLSQQQGSMSEDTFPRTSSIPSPTPMHSHLRTIRMFDHLRILDMTNCNTISDAAIDGIVSKVPRIRNLILAKCTRLTNESVYSIARLGKNLHYLHLGHVSNLTDRAVCHLARSCTRLRYIDLACCPQLTDLSVLELAANLPKLRRIGLVRVTNLTDQAIQSLVERYTSLERIHLSYCENITVPAIFLLLERLTRLTHLSLTGVPAFRKAELQAMCREPPREFNAHQRSAFCVYSGKGVHELRKFLQKAYSGDEATGSQFGELTPEVQRARNNLTVNRGDRRVHSRHGGLGEAALSNRNPIAGGMEQRSGSQHHHQATRSDPQLVYHSHGGAPPPSATIYNVENEGNRLAPVGTTSRIIPSFRTQPIRSSSSSSQSNAMQVDEKIGGWEDVAVVDETAMDETEANESDSAFQTPTATFPQGVFAFDGGSKEASGSNNQQQSKISRPNLTFPTTFTKPGRRFGDSPVMSRVARSGIGGGASEELAALATPPISTSNSFFSPLDPRALQYNEQPFGSATRFESPHGNTTSSSTQLYQQQQQQRQRQTMQSGSSTQHPASHEDSFSSSSPPQSSSS